MTISNIEVGPKYRGVCMAKFNIVYLHFCCSFPKEFKSIVGTQLSLF